MDDDIVVGGPDDQSPESNGGAGEAEWHAAEDAQAGRRMAFGAAIISFFLFLGKVAGYAKNVLIAKWFGGKNIAMADAYYDVYNVLIYATFTNIEKVLRPVYLPQFLREWRSDGEKKAWTLLSVVFNLQVAFLFLFCLILELFAPQIVHLLWRHLSSNEYRMYLAVLLLRAMAPTVVLLSLSLMPELTLHAYKRFALPAFAEFCFRTVLVVGLVVGIEFIWHPTHPRAILAAAMGVVIGGSMRFIVMVPGLWRKLRYYRPVFDPRKIPGAMTVLSLMPPVLFGMAASAGRSIADSVYADRIGSGMYTYLTWARQMGDSALQILPLAISFVVYPFLSEWAHRNDRDKLAEALVGMTRIMAFIFVPLSVAMMFMAKPIITIMFYHGQLAREGVFLSSVALFCYAPGLFFFALEGSINKWYFALQDTKTPNYVGAALAAVHVMIGYVGVMILWRGGTIGAAGALAFVSLALTISKTLKVIMLYGLLRKRIGRIDVRQVMIFVGKLALATSLMAIVIYLIGTLSQTHLAQWATPFHSPKIAQKMRMLVLTSMVAVGGGGVFLVTAALTHIEELAVIWTFLREKVQQRLAR